MLPGVRAGGPARSWTHPLLAGISRSQYTPPWEVSGPQELLGGLPSPRLKALAPQFPQLAGRGLCLSPTGTIMEPQLGSLLQAGPSPHTPAAALATTPLLLLLSP